MKFDRFSEAAVCRNIKTLFNFEPPATEEEIQASAIQFVRKLSGFNKPSKVNEEAFNAAVEEVSAAARTLIRSLVTQAPPRDRMVERLKAKAASAKRFARE
jgi:hypothetical protein